MAFLGCVGQRLRPLTYLFPANGVAGPHLLSLRTESQGHQLFDLFFRPTNELLFAFFSEFFKRVDVGIDLLLHYFIEACTHHTENPSKDRETSYKSEHDIGNDLGRHRPNVGCIRW